MDGRLRGPPDEAVAANHEMGGKDKACHGFVGAICMEAACICDIFSRWPTDRQAGRLVGW